MDMRKIMETVQSLNELQGVKSHPKRFYSKNEFVQYMKERGFVLLGKGQYGAAFDHERFGGRYILKVFSDPAYEHFIDFCMKHPNPHLPRFTGKIMKVSQNGRMIRLERLEPMSGEQYDAANIDEMAADVFEAHLQEPGWVSPFADDSLYQALVGVIGNANQHMQTDFSVDNFMLRGSTVVITDPYVDHEDFKW